MNLYFHPYADERDYVKNNYGHCVLENLCKCIKPGARWLGCVCSNWRPTALNSFEDMLNHLRQKGVAS